MIYEFVDPVMKSSTILPYPGAKEGVAKFENLTQGDYVIIPFYDSSQDFKNMGSLVKASDPDWSSGVPMQTYLKVVEKADGKSVPGKTTKRTGSFLLITEPEYVEWDSSQELYPFVFETIGDWTVMTSVDPPEGFIADYGSLTAKVNTELEAVQFTVTDVGSRWVETEVEYTVSHKGKTEKIKSKIGIKLSKKLAKEKGLGIYGHTQEPGPFKGGKKVKKN